VDAAQFHYDYHHLLTSTTLNWCTNDESLLSQVILSVESTLVIFSRELRRKASSYKLVENNTKPQQIFLLDLGNRIFNPARIL
jgi:hypothetical protein